MSTFNLTQNNVTAENYDISSLEEEHDHIQDDPSFDALETDAVINPLK